MGLADALSTMNVPDALPAPSADKLPSAPSITADVQPNAPPATASTQAPSGGALAASLSSDLPRFQRTFKNTLTGMLLGFAHGNLLGAAIGAIDPNMPLQA